MPVPNPCISVKPAPKPTQPVPSGSVSLLEKRKSLTLCLAPLGINLPSPASSISQRSKPVQNTEPVDRPEAKTHTGTGSYRQTGANVNRDQDPTHSQCRRAQVKEQGSLLPFSFTLNKLLDWGERLLLGEVFAPPVRIGHLPYRC